MHYYIMGKQLSGRHAFLAVTTSISPIYTPTFSFRCVVSMVYYGLGLNVGNLDGDIYVNFAINTSMEAAAYIVCLLLLDRMGRKAMHAGTMILGGVACLSTIFTVIYGNECKYKTYSE